MSTQAISTLREMWKDLVFAQVSRVIARDPDDVLYIQVNEYEPTADGTLYRTNRYREIKSKLLKDIPEAERRFSVVAWKHYYGFASNKKNPGGIYFSNARYAEIDFDISMSLDQCMCGNHHHGWSEKPRIRQWICGRIEDDPKGRGKRFTEWFCVDEQTKLLIEMVQAGRCSLTEQELAYKLLGGGCGYPDTLWSIARLVFFDNVRAFFDEYIGESPTHPCEGLLYHIVQPEGYKLQVTWHKMYLPTTNIAAWVHTLSALLDPQWWMEFKSLCEQHNVSSEHRNSIADWCVACEEQEDDFDWN